MNPQQFDDQTGEPNTARLGPTPFEGVWVTQGPPTSSFAAPPKKGRLALIWSVSGTLISVVGFVALALFEQYSGMLSELRGDLKHFNEISSEFVKRETFQRSRDQIKEHFKELQENSIAKVRLESELKISEKAREELFHELQKVRERIAFLEGHQTASSIANIVGSR